MCLHLGPIKLVQDLNGNLRLAEHIGPVASLVVDRAARKAKTREELLDLVAEHLPPAPTKKR